MRWLQQSGEGSAGATPLARASVPDLCQAAAVRPANEPGRPRDGERRTIAAVVVNYNYARFLKDAVDSVLAQDDPFDEVIVVDDGSTDDSLAVLADYAGRALVVAKPNGGQLSAVLAGCDRAAADYVYVLDADDTVSPRMVARVRPLLSREPVKVQFQLEGVDIERRPLMSQFPSFPSGYGAAEMRSDNRTIGFYICPPTSGNVYRRAFVTGLPRDRVRRDEFIDGPATLAAPYIGEIISIPEPLASYRVHGKNHSRWDKPAVDLLDFEIAWFERRWRDVRELLGDPEIGPLDGDALYVRERRLMLAAMGAAPGRVASAARFCGQLTKTHLPAAQKLLLAVWAVLLTVPSRELSRRLIAGRRSPVNRSRAFKRLLNAVLGRPRAAAA